MGIVTLGIPQQIVIDLAQLNGSTIFVETGTLHGGTTRWASKHFETVHTIERAEPLYHQHHDELAKIRCVTPHLGDSREILPRIVKDLGEKKAVYWLDGHWSGSETAGEHDECPLLDELTCLSARPDDIILIDDARLFLCAPPPPHDPSQWPTVVEIVDALQKLPKTPFVQIVDDVIFIVPDRDALRNLLVEYAQRRSSEFWKEFGKLQYGKSSLASRLSGLLSRVARRTGNN